MQVSTYINSDGLSCYLNSILHILQQIPLFSDYIKSNEYFKNIKNKITSTNKDFISYEIHKLFVLSYKKTHNIYPKTLKEVMAKKNDMWGEMEQQDSQELLIFLITQIEEELGCKIDYIIDFNKIDFNENVNNDLLFLVIFVFKQCLRAPHNDTLDARDVSHTHMHAF